MLVNVHCSSLPPRILKKFPGISTVNKQHWWGFMFHNQTSFLLWCKVRKFFAQPQPKLNSEKPQVSVIFPSSFCTKFGSSLSVLCFRHSHNLLIGFAACFCWAQLIFGREEAEENLLFGAFRELRMLFGNQWDNNIISSFLWGFSVFSAFHSDELDTICRFVCFVFGWVSTNTRKSNNTQINLKAFCSFHGIIQSNLNSISDVKRRIKVRGSSQAPAIKHNRSCLGYFITGFCSSSLLRRRRHQLRFLLRFCIAATINSLDESLSCCVEATRHKSENLSRKKFVRPRGGSEIKLICRILIKTLRERQAQKWELALISI